MKKSILYLDYGKRYSVTVSMVVLLAAGFCSSASAAWNSLRANNRSHEESRGVSRGPQAAPSREHQEGRELGRAPEGGREMAVRRGEIEHEANRRHSAIDEDWRHAYHWYGYHPGMIIGTLPPDNVPVYLGGIPYYYDQGVYYQSTPSGYVVVAPPQGVIVPALPPGAEAVAAGSTVYYYAAGAFYLPQPQGYLVVAPPLGVTVSSLPPGAVPVIINGVQYYQFQGAYFLPVMQGGVVVYTTVQP